MAPIRRYLRITKYSVLECRIYLDNPALVHSWLLNPRNPVLPRVIESVRPLVLPKLREERERERSRKKSKKRSIKDVVIEDDFEVSIFLTETDTRHSLLHKQKHFRDKVQTKLTSNSSKLVGASYEAPIDVDVALLEEAADDDISNLRHEDSEEAINWDEIPAFGETTAEPEPASRKRRRRGPDRPGKDGQELDHDFGAADIVDIESDSSDDNDDLFVGQDESDNSDAEMGPPPSKRRKDKATGRDRDGREEKKKLAMDISYEGFAIYGRVLCLVVKRRNEVAKSGPSTVPPGSKSQTDHPGGQAMMENWISSTQLPEVDAAEEEA
ncbi:hypothetical protein B0H66DRAFT_13698 [Apodospora peruviana]|uniref:Uncharacterized protein n=1 Tax=Apodospora peruviana TaxID=516989 RepID=A0AAE0IQ69_9PEZI|nr:hypothetical protein B0H66DRAFT_13698 [Apodospora peruviana]